jgi:putative ABC transport system permease protein
MTTLTVYHVLSGDPIPQKSDRLFYVQLDPRSKLGYAEDEEPSDQMTRYDGEALLRAAKAERQALMTGGDVAIEPQKAGLSPFRAEARFSSADFFPMFDTPFAFGSGWSAAEDAASARVVVLSQKLNEKLFEGANSVGRTVRLDEGEFRVVGVLSEWRPTPRFYDMYSDHYGEVEQVFVPISTAIAMKMSHSGSTDCWGDSKGDQTGLNAPCTWAQYWVELAPAKAADYRQYLANYSDEQRRAGRFERPTNVRLRNVNEWLDFNHVVPGDVRIQAWLAFGFLLVCLVNAVGLLLAKFLRRSGEIGVRRALGASRRAIFAQALVEAGSIGLAGGLVGLALAQLGLWAVRQQSENLAELAHLDTTMLATTFVLALVASLLAGLLPAWRACQITPAVQLKAQ